MKKLTIAMIALAMMAGFVMAHGDHPSSSETAKVATKVKHQTICPVMGNKINKKLYVDYNGKRLYVCCRGCIRAVKKNPEKWFKKAEATGVTLDRTPVKKGTKAKDTSSATTQQMQKCSGCGMQMNSDAEMCKKCAMMKGNSGRGMKMGGAKSGCKNCNM